MALITRGVITPISVCVCVCVSVKCCSSSSRPSKPEEASTAGRAALDLLVGGRRNWPRTASASLKINLVLVTQTCVYGAINSVLISCCIKWLCGCEWERSEAEERGRWCLSKTHQFSGEDNVLSVCVCVSVFSSCELAWIFRLWNKK